MNISNTPNPTNHITLSYNPDSQMETEDLKNSNKRKEVLTDSSVEEQKDDNPNRTIKIAKRNQSQISSLQSQTANNVSQQALQMNSNINATLNRETNNLYKNLGRRNQPTVVITLPEELKETLKSPKLRHLIANKLQARIKE